jgi:hypothetical protein
LQFSSPFFCSRLVKFSVLKCEYFKANESFFAVFFIPAAQAGGDSETEPALEFKASGNNFSLKPSASKALPSPSKKKED